MEKDNTRNYHHSTPFRRKVYGDLHPNNCNRRNKDIKAKNETTQSTQCITHNAQQTPHNHDRKQEDGCVSNVKDSNKAMGGKN